MPAEVRDPSSHQSLPPDMVVSLADRMALEGEHPRRMLTHLTAEHHYGIGIQR